MLSVSGFGNYYCEKQPVRSVLNVLVLGHNNFDFSVEIVSGSNDDGFYFGCLVLMSVRRRDDATNTSGPAWPMIGCSPGLCPSLLSIVSASFCVPILCRIFTQRCNVTSHDTKGPRAQLAFGSYD